MSARVVLAMAAALAAGSAWAADEKQSATRVDSSRSTATRSSSGSSERSTATRSSSGSSERSSASRSDRSSSARSSSERSSSSRSSSARGPETDAQRRHPRPGTGTGRFDFDHRDRGRFGWGSPYYGWGYGYGYGYGRGRYGRYGYYYDPYDSWYSPYYYSGYYGYSPTYYRRGRGYGYYRDSGSVRLIVDPEKTRVYVDGYYAGIVDDFDGILQRLNVPPGRHDITLKLEGYRTQHFKVYVPVDDTIKIHYDMVRGSGEAVSEEFARHPEADYGRVRDMSDDDRDDDRYRRGRDDDDSDDRDFRGESGDTGSVRLSISPRDASVYVDGEFRGSGRDSSSLRLSPGRHRIEVVRPGYRTIEREIEVESGRSTSVEFELERM